MRTILDLTAENLFCTYCGVPTMHVIQQGRVKCSMCDKVTLELSPADAENEEVDLRNYKFYCEICERFTEHMIDDDEDFRCSVCRVVQNRIAPAGPLPFIRNPVWAADSSALGTVLAHSPEMEPILREANLPPSGRGAGEVGCCEAGQGGDRIRSLHGDSWLRNDARLHRADALPTGARAA